MKSLLKNGTVVNVFTGELEQANVLIGGSKILGVGAYTDADADAVEDISGKYLCPGFLDGHIHIESTMLLPAEFARAALPHGTTAVVADPHEIANVCGIPGIQFMLASSEDLPLTVYLMLPSCVPATPFDESGAVLTADDLEPFYSHPRVLGLAEVMDYVGVIRGKPGVTQKIKGALAHGLTVNGHAPLLGGRELDAYIAAGIADDHECSSPEEAMERIRKGQRVMIRQGTAARNLTALLPLFDEPFAHRCLLVADDKHPADLVDNGHIDSMIRMAVQNGKSPVTGIQMATLWAAEAFGLRHVGAVAPGYTADLLVLDDLGSVSVRDVYKSGRKAVENGTVLPFPAPSLPPGLEQAVCHSFHLEPLTAKDFSFHTAGIHRCRVIALVKNQLLTGEQIQEVDFSRGNGIDIQVDRLKAAVIERHRNTGHIGLGLISGIGLKEGAIASSVSHDSHNLIVIGTNEEDMAFAANRIRALGGGILSVCHGKTIAEMPLPYAGLMTSADALAAAAQNAAVRDSVYRLGVPEELEPFMTMAFASLPVIPHLKLTTTGLVDVDRQQRVPFLMG